MLSNEWSEQARFSRPSGEVGSFGFSVGLEESIAVVGVPQTFQLGQELNYTNPSLNKSSSVYVYTRTDTKWTLAAKMNSLQPGADGFGYAVALGANNLVVGAPYAVGMRKGDGIGEGVTMYDETGAVTETSDSSSSFTASSTLMAGAVYTYTLVNDTWTSTGVLVPRLAQEGDLYGWNVDISTDGTRLVVGAPGTTSDGIKSGVAYVYLIDATGAWNLEETLIPTDAENGAWFGYSVALDVSDAIIGTKTARSAYIFHNLVTGWTQDAKLVGSDTQVNDGFGSSVAIYSTYIVIGSPSNLARGAAYVWELDMVYGSWVQILKLTAAMPSSQLGTSVSIGSRFLLVGGPSANHEIGQVVTMTLDTSGDNSPSEDSSSVEDAAVLIRFSGDSSSMDLLLTRKILSEAAGTGTAQTEVRIVDLTSPSTSVSSHLFGLKVLFTSSDTMSALNAARNLLAALSEIRFRLNTAVGAVSGTAEMTETSTPEAPDSSVTRTQVSAVVFLVLLTILTTALLVYFTLERRKKIAADQREADQADAERELKKAEMASRKTEKRPKARRGNAVLRSTKRKDRSFLQAENDAAGIEFGETLFGEDEYPFTPRGGADDDPLTARIDYDPTESIEGTGGYDPTPLHLPDDGPSFSLDDDLNTSVPPSNINNDGPRIDLDDSDYSSHASLQDPVADDGPRIMLDLGGASSRHTRSSIDDGPSFANDGPSFANDGPSFANDGPSFANDGPSFVDDGPSLDNSLGSDGPSIGSSLANDGPSFNDGPTFSNDGPRISFESIGSNGTEPGANRASLEYPYDMSIGPQLPPQVVPILDLSSHTVGSNTPTLRSQARPAAENVVSIPMDDGPKLTAAVMPVNDGPSLSLAMPSTPTRAGSNQDVADSDPETPSTPSRSRRPANVPRLNFNI